MLSSATAKTQSNEPQPEAREIKARGRSECAGPEGIRAPIAMLGVPFDHLTMGDARRRIAQMIESRQPHYAATANVDFVVQALEDTELRRILAEADLVLCDGMPLVWASRTLGNPLPERVTGSGLVPLLLADAEREGWRVFLLGGTESSVTQAAANTMAKHPKLKLVGAWSPPFEPLLEMDNAKLLRRIRDARPDLLLVAFGCPKQEKWIYMNYLEAGVPFSMGVGATIDFLAGTFKRAPLWMQQTGTEWIFRMLQEPSRLARRYGKDLVVFGRAIVRQFGQLRCRNMVQEPVAEAAPTVERRGTIEARAPSRLDAAAMEQCLPIWEQALDVGNLLLDLSGTRFSDSTGIGGMTRLRKRARERNRLFVLVSPGGQLKRALQMMKLESIFTIADDLMSARSMVWSEAVPMIKVEPMPGGILLRWSGEVIAGSAAEFERLSIAEARHLAAGGRITVDLSAAPFMDSTGLGMMIRLKKKFGERHVEFCCANPSPAVREMLKLTRLDDVLLEKRSAATRSMDNRGLTI
jgi:N-acetylglucosaminyldiphosphoundecaprenol N-acetyl-beta-D-mannosaminyltransferase